MYLFDIDKEANLPNLNTIPRAIIDDYKHYCDINDKKLQTVKFLNAIDNKKTTYYLTHYNDEVYLIVSYTDSNWNETDDVVYSLKPSSHAYKITNIQPVIYVTEGNYTRSGNHIWLYINICIANYYINLNIIYNEYYASIEYYYNNMPINIGIFKKPYLKAIALYDKLFNKEKLILSNEYTRKTHNRLLKELIDIHRV